MYWWKFYITADELDCGNKLIQVVGNYSPSNHDASRRVNPNGIAPTVKENHGTVTAIIENKNQVSNTWWFL